MKILIVLIKWKGGVGRVVRNQKRELEKLGHKVKVLTREETPDFFIRSKLIEYDIIFSQDWSIALRLMFRKNHYVCFHGHNPQFLGKVIQQILGILKGKKLFVVGDTLKERFPKATILYNAVDPKEFYDLKKERKYLGWIKRDYEEITKAGAKSMAEDHGLKLSIAENIPPEKMNEWYNSLKVFVSYPKSFTGFNMCWIEAKASGVPIILGNGNGIGIKKSLKSWKKLTWKNNVKELLRIINKVEKEVY